MNKDEQRKLIRDAREQLGRSWGKGRPLTYLELGVSLRLVAGDPNAAVRDIERGKTTLTGPVSALLELYLSGVLPPDGIPNLED